MCVLHDGAQRSGGLRLTSLRFPSLPPPPPSTAPAPIASSNSTRLSSSARLGSALRLPRSTLVRSHGPAGTTAHGGRGRSHTRNRRCASYATATAIAHTPCAVLSCPSAFVVCAESLESLAARTTDVYDQLLLREIPNRDAEFNCGRSYLDSDRPDLAEEVFRRCIEAGYKPVDSRFRLAQSLAGQHRHTEAKREIIMVLQDDPEHEEAIEWYHEFQEHVNRGTSTNGSEQTDDEAKTNDDDGTAELTRGCDVCALLVCVQRAKSPFTV